MTKSILHITNGTHLTNYLTELNITGEKLTWQEMLCEGPTQTTVANDDFLKLRSGF